MKKAIRLIVGAALFCCGIYFISMYSGLLSTAIGLLLGLSGATLLNPQRGLSPAKWGQLDREHVIMLSVAAVIFAFIVWAAYLSPHTVRESLRDHYLLTTILGLALTVWAAILVGIVANRLFGSANTSDTE